MPNERILTYLVQKRLIRWKIFTYTNQYKKVIYSELFLAN